LSFAPGSSLQFLFLGLGITLFLMGHFMYRDAWTR
jgi:hypothetical protein